MKHRFNFSFAIRTIRLWVSSILMAMSLIILTLKVEAQTAVSNTDVPRIITYQGQVATNDGIPLMGTHQITATLYSDRFGKETVWSGSYNANIIGGVFSITLGSGAQKLPTSDAMDRPLWIGISIDGGIMQPLTELTSAPYAINVSNNSITFDKLSTDLQGQIMNLGIGKKNLPQACNNEWNTVGNNSPAGGGGNPSCASIFGFTDNGNDISMVNNNHEQMRLLTFNGTGTEGISIPTTSTAAGTKGQGVIFQNLTSTFIHSFGGTTNFFAGNLAGNLSMNTTTSPAVDNTGVGFKALFSLTIGTNNTANGFGTLSNNTSGNSNTAIGVDALNNNASAGDNTATGFKALFNNNMGGGVGGSDNTASGFESLLSNTTGSDNTASGSQALNSNTTGSSNTANGFDALNKCTTGSFNTATGAEALSFNTMTGSYNTADGFQALITNTSGGYNTASGIAALHDNTTGNYNSACGDAALYDNTTGSKNIAIGLEAGYTITTGSNNTFVGTYSDAGFSNLTNVTAIGFGATVNSSNTIVLGNSSVTAVSTYGHIVTQSTIGSTAVDGTEVTGATAAGSDVAGNVSLTTSGGNASGYATINFATSYGSAPTVVLTPSNSDAASATLTSTVYVTSTVSSFTIHLIDPTAASPAFNYIVIN